VRTAERTGGGMRVGASATGGAEIEIAFGRTQSNGKPPSGTGANSSRGE
jgi:hypothetical protein